MKTNYFLVDVCNITMGQSPDSASYNSIGKGMPFFQGNADFGEISPTARVWCDKPTKIAHSGDVLISVRAPIGALNIANVDCCIGRGLAALTVDESICLKKYLWYFLVSRVTELNSKGTGSTFKAIGKSVLQETLIPILPLSEQENIVCVLDKVGDVINARKQQLSKLDELVKSRFIEMFGDPVKNDMGWKTKKLNDVCDGIGDGLHGTPIYDECGEYPFINGNNLTDGKIVITSATKMVSEVTYIKHFVDVSHNAILISINGTLGRLAFYNGEKVMLGKSACYCNLKPTVNKVFVYGVMQSDAFAEFLYSSSTKSTIKNVGLKAMREFNLILPPTDLQNQFAIFVEQTDKLKHEVKQSLEKLETLKKSLMQKYFG